MGIVAAIVAPLRAFHIIRKDRDNLKDKLGRKPSIEVRPEIHNGRAVLEVRNKGCKGRFRAKARMYGKGDPELYTMYWESVGSGWADIAGNGGQESILAAECSRTVRLEGGVTTVGIKLFKMGSTIEQASEINSKDVTLDIEITSEPEMEQVFKRRYRLYEPAFTELKFEETGNQ
jgi:hypothetical protein